MPNILTSKITVGVPYTDAIQLPMGRLVGASESLQALQLGEKDSDGEMYVYNTSSTRFSKSFSFESIVTGAVKVSLRDFFENITQGTKNAFGWVDEWDNFVLVKFAPGGVQARYRGGDKWYVSFGIIEDN